MVYMNENGAQNENFTTVNVGKLNEIKEYKLAMGNFSILEGLKTSVQKYHTSR